MQVPLPPLRLDGGLGEPRKHGADLPTKFQGTVWEFFSASFSFSSFLFDLKLIYAKNVDPSILFYVNFSLCFINQCLALDCGIVLAGKPFVTQSGCCCRLRIRICCCGWLFL